MNYFNPYSMMSPMASTARPGLFGALKGVLGRSGITFSSILNGTQKTLGIVNQTIPLVKQATPMFKNAKTMFKVMNEFKKVDTPLKNTNKTSQNATIQNEKSEGTDYTGGPTFFI